MSSTDSITGAAASADAATATAATAAAARRRGAPLRCSCLHALPDPVP